MASWLLPLVWPGLQPRPCHGQSSPGRWLGGWAPEEGRRALGMWRLGKRVIQVTGHGLCGPWGAMEREKPGTTCLFACSERRPQGAHLKEAGLAWALSGGTPASQAPVTWAAVVATTLTLCCVSSRTGHRACRSRAAWAGPTGFLSGGPQASAAPLCRPLGPSEAGPGMGGRLLRQGVCPGFQPRAPPCGQGPAAACQPQSSGSISTLLLWCHNKNGFEESCLKN